MKLYFRVGNVLLTRGGGAQVSLQREDWFYESGTEVVDIGGGELAPKLIKADPGDPGAEAMISDESKITELRLDKDPGWRPGAHLVVDIDVV